MVNSRVTAHLILSADLYLDATSGLRVCLEKAPPFERAGGIHSDPQSLNRGQVADVRPQILVNHHRLSAAAATQSSDVIDVPDTRTVVYESEIRMYSCCGTRGPIQLHRPP